MGSGTSTDTSYRKRSSTPKKLYNLFHSTHRSRSISSRLTNSRQSSTSQSHYSRSLNTPTISTPTPTTPITPIEQQQNYKILLLGCGETGKSTIFKQLNNLYNNKSISNHINTDALDNVSGIRKKILDSMIRLLIKFNLIKKNIIYTINISDINISQKICYLLNFIDTDYGQFYDDSNDIDKNKMYKIGVYIYYLWKLDIFQNLFYKKHNFFMSDNLDYFFDKSKEIFSKHYIPSNDDVFKISYRTTGVLSLNIKVWCKDRINIFECYDTGGQRNERIKWWNDSTNVNSIVYVASLNHYCQVLFEDERCNAMHESIKMFELICNSKTFEDCSIILLYTKNDLFQKSIKKGHNLEIAFGDNNNEWKYIDNGNNIWDQSNNYIFTNWQLNDNKSDLLIHGFINNFNTEISNDICDLIKSFVYDWKFENCYNKSLKFIKNAYESRCIDKSRLKSFVIDATNTRDVENMFEQASNMIITHTNQRKNIKQLLNFYL